MAKNKISDLRDHLFETLEALKDEQSPMEIDRALAVCTTAQTIINTAKLEVDMLKTTERISTSSFFQLQEESPAFQQLTGSKTPTA